jgi:hypothetical protein
MKRKRWSIITIILIIVIVFSGCAAAGDDAAQNAQVNEINETNVTNETQEGSSTEAVTGAASASSAVAIDKEFTARDLEVGYDETDAVKITLNGNSATVTGEGANIEDQTVTISKEGSYIITGTLENGQIIVDAGDADKVQLILNGASVHCSAGAPIYIRNADKVFITLQEGTQNHLSDGTEYVQTDENNVDGVIFSKADLTLNGSGSLTITANYKQGIVSKDDLVFTGGTYHITAVKDAINGKDCVKIKDGSFTLSAATGNGVQSKNGDDTTKGYVYICGGVINITNSQEGIEGTVIIVEGGVIDINSEDDGLNAASKSADTASENNAATGMPSENETPVADSTQALTMSEDSRQSIPEKAEMPSDRAFEDGKFPPEGTDAAGSMKGERPEFSGQAPSGNMNRGGFGGGENPFEADTNCYITISGGTVTINAGGDGIDSNGDLYISGGTIYVDGPTQSMNGSLDYAGTGTITGGTLVAAGSSGMAQGFGETSTQYSLLYNLSAASEANTQVTLTDSSGKSIISYTPRKQYQSVVISSPDMVQGETYTLTCGAQTAEITLSSISTSNGPSMGMGQRKMGQNSTN